MRLRPPLLLAAVLLAGFNERSAPSKPLDPNEAAPAGRALAEQLLEQQPSHSFTNSGILKIGRRIALPIQFCTFLTPTNWCAVYQATLSNQVERLLVRHSKGAANTYFCWTNANANLDAKPVEMPSFEDLSAGRRLSEADLAAPFAGSDFWLCDLGLEFLHWPDQRIEKRELRKTRLCSVLTSTNPKPAPGAYSRVVSWIDTESLGLIHADAYDASGELLKEFDPKSLKEVNGQPELVRMEIYNRQTRSRSQIEFDLDPN